MKIETPFNIEISGLTWVNTPKGILMADKLTKLHSLFAPDLKSDQQAANVLTNSSKEVIEIILKNGNSIVVDSKTTFLTPDGWKSAAELTDKDLILNKVAVIEQNSGGQSIPYKQDLNTNSMPITIPNKMNPSFAEWIGMIVSIGRYNQSNGHVSIYTDTEEVANHFSYLTNEIFKLKPLVSEDRKRKRKKEYYIISQNVVNFLRTWVGPTPLMRRVPSFLVEGSTEEHLAFIAGLGINAKLERDNLIIYQGSSKVIADFTSVVLRNSGYLVYQQMVKKESSNYYIIRIIAKSPKALTLHLLLPDLENKISDTMNYLVPVNEDVLNQKLPYYHPLYAVFYKMKKNKKSLMTFESLKELDKNTEMDYYFMKISKINKSRSKTVLIKTLYNSGLLVNSIVVGGFY